VREREREREREKERERVCESGGLGTRRSSTRKIKRISKKITK